MGLDVGVKMRVIGAVCGLVGLVVPAVAQPTITNTTQGTTHATLADAVSASTNGDVIEIGEGVLYEQGLILNNRILTIRGVGAAETIIDGNFIVGRIFSVRSASDVVFEDLTMRNGVAQANGGKGGGAVRVGGDSTAVMRDCILENNSDRGDGAGAVSLQTSGDVVIERCHFFDSSGTVYGSIYRGGVGGLVLRGCLFSVETGGTSVVMHASPGDLDMLNCTFADNLSPHHLLVGGGTGDVINCAFDDSVTVPIDVLSGASITLDMNVYPGGTGSNIDGVPTFVDATSGDYRLAAGSPGIDAGDTLTASSVLGFTDLGGAPRLNDDPATVDTGVPVFDASIDVGAYEFAPATCAADFNEDGLVNTGDVLSFLNVYTAGCP